MTRFDYTIHTVLTTERVPVFWLDILLQGLGKSLIIHTVCSTKFRTWLDMITIHIDDRKGSFLLVGYSFSWNGQNINYTYAVQISVYMTRFDYCTYWRQKRFCSSVCIFFSRDHTTVGRADMHVCGQAENMHKHATIWWLVCRPIHTNYLIQIIEAWKTQHTSRAPHKIKLQS